MSDTNEQGTGPRRRRRVAAGERGSSGRTGFRGPVLGPIILLATLLAAGSGPGWSSPLETPGPGWGGPLETPGPGWSAPPPAAAARRAGAPPGRQELGSLVDRAIEAAEAVVRLAEGCDDLACPVVDCGQASELMVRLHTIHGYLLRLLNRHRAAGDADAERSIVSALTAVRGAIGAILPCLGRAGCIGSSSPPGSYGSTAEFRINVALNSDASADPSADPIPDELEQMERWLFELENALPDFDIRDECPPGLPGDIEVCAPCEEAGERFREAQEDFEVLSRLAQRDPTVQDEMEAARDDRNEAWADLRSCLLLLCTEAPYAPSTGRRTPRPPAGTLLSWCPRCWELDHLRWDVERIIRGSERRLARIRERIAPLEDLRAELRELQARGESSDILELRIEQLESLEELIPVLEAEVRDLFRRLDALIAALAECQQDCEENRDRLGLGGSRDRGLRQAGAVLFTPGGVDAVLVDPTGEPPPPGPGDVVDLTVVKSDLADPVENGDEIVYRVTVTNSGTGTSAATTLTDTLPGSVTFVSASAGCLPFTSSILTCDVPPLGPGESIDLEIRVAADPVIVDSTVTNRASVPLDPNEADGSDNEDTEETRIVSSPQPQPCPLNIVPGSYGGDNGCGIGDSQVSCPAPDQLRIQSETTTLMCDANGFCGADNVILGAPDHTVNVFAEDGDVIRVEARNNTTGGQCTERLTLQDSGQ